MRFFSALSRPWSRKSVTSSWALLREFLNLGESNSGATVNWRTAIEASAVLACVRVIAEGLAQVPLKVYRESRGQRLPARELALYELLSIRPNEVHTAYELRELLAVHTALTGNFFAFVNWVGGEPIELLPYEPGRVMVEKDGDWRLRYRHRLDDGSEEPIPTENMLHVRGPSLNGWMGLDATRVAREAIGLSLTMEEHTARFFRNGAIGGDLLTTDHDLTEDQVELLKKSWRENYAGTGNAYKTAVMWGGITWQSRAANNQLSQLYELRGQQVEDICQRFHVNPIMIGFSGDKTPTYASAEQLFLAHVIHCLGPWYTRIEQRLQASLLTEQQRRAGYYIKHTVTGLMRGAHKDRAEYFARALGSGGGPAWMTQDEVRGLEELNPVGGTAADLPVATNVGGPAPSVEDE